MGFLPAGESVNFRFTKAISDVQFTNNDLRLLVRWYGGREVDVMDFDENFVKTFTFENINKPSVVNVHDFAEKYFMDEFDRRRMRKVPRMA